MTRPNHVAIIMDGNGRWAQRRGLPRVAGHRRGVQAVRRTVESVCKLEIPALTLFAFSSDNWSRPPAEVSALMGLLRQYLRSEIAQCVEQGVRIRMIGRRDRLESSLVREIEAAEKATLEGNRLDLRLAVDYSGRDAILAAARTATEAELDRESFARLIAGAIGAPDARPVDLLIRTGGERRLSDFLLWESAYAELVFVEEMWPDFDEVALKEAIEEFGRRQRRFGRVPDALTG